MKLLRGGLISSLSLASLVIVSPGALAATVSAGDADGTPQLLTELQFSSATQMLSSTAATSATAKTLVSMPAPSIDNPGWVIGGQSGGSTGVQATSGPAGNPVNALEGSYPLPGAGGQYLWADYSVANLNTEDVYIEFWAKMPGATGGCKFLKIFGDHTSSSGHARATFGTDYTGADSGGILQVTFGDGSSLKNDGQNVIKLDGSNPQFMGRSYGSAVVSTPQKTGFSSADWGTNWHHFLVHVKFNSGTTMQNEVPNGEFFLQIDGKVYLDATGVYNRNPANGPINYIELFGWAQKDPSPFQVWFYDVRISTGGFVSQPLPSPPTGLAAQ